MSRRALLASTAALIGGRACAQQADSDRGIGGTGVAPAEPEGPGIRGTGDRGIGGTGVIGTIRRFGSIYVNDLRIEFPRHVAVLIDDRAARIEDLRLGHVVGVLAEHRAGRLSTRLISVTSEVVGPVEVAAPGHLVVLGQRVSVRERVDGKRNRPVPSRWRIGDFVAVSGLRRLDGTIVASLIEHARPGPMRLSGPAVAEPDGTIMIGTLPIAGLGSALAGRRVSLVGHLAAGSFVVDRAERPMDRLLARRPSHVSIEAYVAQVADNVQLGSGVDMRGAAQGLSNTGGAKAIVTAAVRSDGRLDLETVRLEDGRRGSRGTGPGAATTPATPGALHGPPTPAPPGFGPPGTGFGTPGDPGGSGFGPGHFGAQTAPGGAGQTGGGIGPGMAGGGVGSGPAGGRSFGGFGR